MSEEVRKAAIGAISRFAESWPVLAFALVIVLLVLGVGYMGSERERSETEKWRDFFGGTMVKGNELLERQNRLLEERADRVDSVIQQRAGLIERLEAVERRVLLLSEDLANMKRERK